MKNRIKMILKRLILWALETDKIGVPDSLIDRVDDLESASSQLDDRLDDVEIEVSSVESLSRDLQDLDSRVDDLENDLSDKVDESEMEKEIKKLRVMIDDLERKM